MKENKMGVMSVGKLLITMSLPMMISQIVQALYNIVDSIFVSQINENALTAVSLAFPVQMLLIAFANGVGVGMNALVSKALGEKNGSKANAIAKNGLFLAAVSYIIFLLVGIFLARPFLITQMTADTDPQILEYGVSYLSIVCIFSFGLFTQIAFERLFQATGRTVYTMIIQATGAIINIILDPILIFGYFGLPKMGVAGAAAATVIGQIIAALLAVILHQRINKEVRINHGSMRLDGGIIGNILKIGIPTTIMQAIGSVMSYCMNRILIVFSSTATAVFGAYFKIQSIVCMPVFGLNNGMVPIVAYNYGAQKRSRIIKTIKLSLLVGEAITLVGLAVFQLFPGQLLGMFSASDYMLEIGIPALRTMSISFVFSGICIVSGSVFQALGNGVYSALMSFSRQIIVLIPVAYIFAKLGELSLVWWSFPIAEVASLAVSVTLLLRIYRKVILNVQDNP
ncbi:MAG: MATE family efflux transporter [Oscillospiraceae bacterium]